MSKTPYEIRLELLAMAQSIVSENMYSERARLEQDWQFQRELVLESIKCGTQWAQSSPFPELPKINSDDIIDLAAKLNDFVSRNDSKSE